MAFLRSQIPGPAGVGLDIDILAMGQNHGLGSGGQQHLPSRAPLLRLRDPAQAEQQWAAIEAAPALWHQKTILEALLAPEDFRLAA